jgi:hypothetical protein
MGVGMDDVKTLRDEIAIAAMKNCITPQTRFDKTLACQNISRWAYKMADAMMKERNKNG